MKLSMRAVLGAAFLAALSALPAAAQEWPSRPVKVIVPYPPGGTNDNVARAYTEKLTQRLGQQFVIENRGGAGGALGLEAGAKSPPDGYTLIIGPFATLSILPHTRKAPFDPFKDFAFVGRVTDGIYGMGVNPSVPANTLQEFIAYAKANPGKINFASSGLGSSTQFAGEALNIAAGIQMTHVPYRGSAEALNDVLAGNVDVFIEGVVFPYYKPGKLKILGVTSAKRHPLYPEIPTIAEIVPSYKHASWTSFIAPAGTPRPIIDKLSETLNWAADQKDLQDRLLAVGLVARHDTPDEMLEGVRQDSDRYAKLVKQLNIKMD